LIPSHPVTLTKSIREINVNFGADNFRSDKSKWKTAMTSAAFLKKNLEAYSSRPSKKDALDEVIFSTFFYSCAGSSAGIWSERSNVVIDRSPPGVPLLAGNGFEISVPRCLATTDSVGAFHFGG
jgi:hypothetical protein